MENGVACIIWQALPPRCWLPPPPPRAPDRGRALLPAAAAGQGRTLIHLQAQRKHFSCDTLGHFSASETKNVSGCAE